MRLSLFSWGFWGWGTATEELVKVIDAAERQRGFSPPLFVDIRLHRSGRAPGFRDDAFERLIGGRRYVWMKQLGNRSIRSGGRMAIQSPEAVNELLDRAIEAAARRSRVIFFCACHSPNSASRCHRSKVTRYLLQAAKDRGIQVAVQEWPGGKPSRTPIRIKVSPETLIAARRGAKTFPLTVTRLPTGLAALPWGTIVLLTNGSDQHPVAVGPVTFRRGRWALERFLPSDAASVVEAHRESLQERARLGIDR